MRPALLRARGRPRPRMSVTVLALMVVVILIGINSYSRLPRESNPDIKIPFVSVYAPYYGTSPNDMENVVTRKLETQLKALPDLTVGEQLLVRVGRGGDTREVEVKWATTFGSVPEGRTRIRKPPSVSKLRKFRAVRWVSLTGGPWVSSSRKSSR